MRNIAIIGAGVTGLVTAHGLIKQGYKVTLFSDKSPQDFLSKAHPTGAAVRFNMALDIERELGLNHWEHQAPKADGAHITFINGDSNRLMTLCGRSQHYVQGIDPRLQSHQWMLDLEEQGGKVIIEHVSTARLDDIASAHDLTLVAGGRREICQLFKRNEKLSVYTQPPRKLAMVVGVGNKKAMDGVSGLPVKFNIFAKHGECIFAPWYHKDHGHAWSLQFGAKHGGALDKFGAVKNGEQAMEMALKLIKEMMPWEHEWSKNMVLADEHSWLTGSFVPEVREPVATLPSGNVVMGLGDTVVSMDPVGGQGANHCNKMSKNVVNAIVAHQNKPFDAHWMNATFEQHWQQHHWGNDITNLLLEPPVDAVKELLIAQYGSTGDVNDSSVEQKIADAFTNNFNDPAVLTQTLQDLNKARALIEECTGKHWLYSAIRGRLKIGKGQLRQLVRLNPKHPPSSSISIK
jgi:2-polyprenyl-6-methoxyphenol hydroxylase-like FAD-dependent oxidoreductase